MPSASSVVAAVWLRRKEAPIPHYPQSDAERAAAVIRTHSVSELAGILMANGYEGSWSQAETKAFEMKTVEASARHGGTIRRYLVAGLAFAVLVAVVTIGACIVEAAGAGEEPAAVTVPSGAKCLLAGDRHLGFEAGVAIYMREKGFGGWRQNLTGARLGEYRGNGWRDYEAVYEFSRNGATAQWLFGGRIHTGTCEHELY